MGKRSPILGYNHNVRYRGLVFHVQTEDSGIASPHLFTHLFHHGVIVSTRKLVYDAGSAEEAIKSLMQAQHKATLKDLRRGHFDDKIDSYLGGTPGLLPRGADDAAARPSEGELAPSAGTVEEIALGGPTTQQVEPMFDEPSAPEIIIFERTPPPSRTPAPPARPAHAAPPVSPVPARPASERPLAPVAVRSMPALVDTTLKTEMPMFDPLPEFEPPPYESAPDIEIEVELPLNLDDSSDTIAIPRRLIRDTEMQPPFNEATRPTLDVRFNEHTKPTVGRLDELVRRPPSVSDGVPGAIRPSSPALPPRSSDSRRLGDPPSSPALPPRSSDSRRLGDRPSNPAIPPLPSDSRRLGDRPSTINAATLPPARPISRPPTRPALPPPPIVARPVTADDRNHREPEPAEGYAPSAASLELPPSERLSQYAQHKKASPRLPTDLPRSERAGGAPIPAGLGRPPRLGTSPPVKPNPSPPSGPTSASMAAASPNAGQTEPAQGRTPTPARTSPPGPVAARSGGKPGSGVVMTRPAVIVGAPAKSVGTVPRIRKAREDEGRGFGQGLISEKSLDEVILAYLSEDADEK